jgi:hypothetical protein
LVVEKETLQRRTFRVEQSPLEKVRLWVEIIAFAAAGLWAIYTFIYQTQIAPAFIPAHEVFAVSVQRLASTTSGSIQRVQLTIRNDGTVDVDTAALALNVYSAATSSLRWQTSASPNSFELHFPNLQSWSVRQAFGHLFDGAVGGQRKNHILLRPGDSFDLEFPVAVPREDHLLRVEVDTSYYRYPIRTDSVAVRLVRRANGTVELSGKYYEVNFGKYFGV